MSPGNPSQNKPQRIALKPRVLVVDDEQEDRDIYVDLLKIWGFTPFVARGKGQELVEKAVAMNQKHRCQLAIVDMRLRDNQDTQDESGLQLISLLAPTQVIVVSAYGNVAQGSESLVKLGAYYFLGKQDGPEKLRKILDEAAALFCVCRRRFEVGWAGLGEDEIRQFKVWDESFPVDEFDDLLGRLFPKARRLRVVYHYPTILRPKSRFLLVKPDDRQPVLVKLARSEKIKKEVESYKLYVEDRLKGMYCPPLKEYAILWDIGGAIYPFLGSEQVEPFSEYYAHASASQIHNSLSKFFTHTWRDLYRRRKRVKAENNLVEAFHLVWGRQWYDRRLMEFKPVPPQEGMPEHWAALNAPEPKAWLMERISHNRGIPGANLSISHGDLHADNMLVDNHHNIWVIDFERTGYGPDLQDFIELEADIIGRLAGKLEGDTVSFYRLCCWSAASQSLDQPMPVALGDSADLEKAVSVIGGIRKLARAVTGEADAYTYLWGLLLNTLFRATLYPSPPPYPPVILRSLMFASILCHRLDHWGQAWPPDEWPNLS